MFALAVAAYFLLACLVSWLIFFPPGRERFLQALAGAWQRRHQRLARTAQHPAEGVVKIQQAVRDSLRGVIAFARRHYLLCIGGIFFDPASAAVKGRFARGPHPFGPRPRAPRRCGFRPRP